MARKLLALVMTIPLMTACAAFQASANDITPKQKAALLATCSKVMRLPEWRNDLTDGCVSSLSDSLQYQLQAAKAAVAYRDCGQNGLKPSSVEFSRCVLDAENGQIASSSASIGALPQLDASYIKAADSNPRDYFETSFDMRHRREQYSCAELGLRPDTEPFVTCVNKLDMDLFIIEHPEG
jgi:hypothetical protein